MTDYTKLIEELRGHLLSVPLQTLQEAANAIEELVTENERLNGIIDVFVKEDTE
jgi:hypothetical protein